MRFCFPILLAGFFACCVNAQTAIDITAALTPTNAVAPPTNAVETNQPDPPAAGFSMDDRHKLEPGDKISFQILEDKSPPLTLTVTDSSELDVPYIGRVSVTNKTCRELAADLKIPLEKDYYYHATVIIGLNSVNRVRGQVFVFGQVKIQGPIDILNNHKLTVGEAISRSGGFADFADKKAVKVLRNNGGADGQRKIILLNMVDILEFGDTQKDVVLEPGDSIVVPSRSINF